MSLTHNQLKRAGGMIAAIVISLLVILPWDISNADNRPVWMQLIGRLTPGRAAVIFVIWLGVMTLLRHSPSVGDPSLPQEEPDQKIVEEDELRGYLHKGWEVAATLRSGKVVIRRREQEEIYD